MGQSASTVVCYGLCAIPYSHCAVIWAHICQASQSKSNDLGSVRVILFIIIQKAQLILDQHSQLCGPNLRGGLEHQEDLQALHVDAAI